MSHRQFVLVSASALIIVSVVAGRGVKTQAPASGGGTSNTYRRVTDWAQLPSQLKWAAVIGVEQGPDGNMYVLHRCFENSCAGRMEPPILKFDSSGKLLKTWGIEKFSFPHGFHVDSQGNVWATDTRIHQVFKFSADGSLLMTLGKNGTAGNPPELLNEPTDVVTNRNGDIFVTEGHAEGVANRVSKFSKDGRFTKSWGTSGAGPGMFNAPHTIAIDSRGRLFVGDRSNNRIQVFDQDGRFVAEWRQFGRPSGVFITKDDTMYVADSESNTTAVHAANPGYTKGIRIGSAKDGRIVTLIEDIESTTGEPSGAEGVGVDNKGNIYGAVVRRRMLERFVK